MTYRILFSTKAKNQLIKLQDSERIVKKLYEIRESPFSFLKKLKGKFWRLRVGKYRVIIDVVIKGKTLYIVLVGKRVY